MLGGGAARPGEEADPEGFDERGGGQPGGQGDGGDGHGQHHGGGRAGCGEAVDQGLEQQPLADEAVARGQGDGAQRTDGEQRGGDRHAGPQAAEGVQVTGAGGVQDGAGRAEQQGLERGVVDRVQQGGGQGERGGRVAAARVEEQGRAHADQHQTEVLAGGVGQQPREVGGHGGLHDPVHRADGAERDRQQPPPARPAAEQVEADADQAVHAEVRHRRAHQGRDVTRGLRIHPGEPGVQRHHVGLGAEAHQRQDEHGAPYGR